MKRRHCIWLVLGLALLVSITGLLTIPWPHQVARSDSLDPPRHTAGPARPPGSRLITPPAIMPERLAAQNAIVADTGGVPMAHAEPGSVNVSALRADGTPNLDGNPGEWAGLAPIHLDRTTASMISGSIPTLADLSAGLRVAWAPDRLYFAAVIADDVLVGNNSTEIWGDDVLELAIHVPQDSQTHQFTLCVDGRVTDNGTPISALTFVTRTVPGGWTLEVAIPATALGLSTFQSGEQYPFNFALWDDDLFTYPGQTHMFWQSNSVSTYNPDWGILYLSPQSYIFPAQAVVNVLQAAGTPSLDGNPGEWAGLAPIQLDRTTASVISGAVPTLADLSADLRVAWASGKLYFAAAITDDVLVGNNSTQIWGDDVLELAIHVPQNGQTHQFTLCVDGRMTDSGNPVSSLTFVTRAVPGGWTLEVVIPAAALGLTMFAADQQYPFNVALWDDDLFTYPGQTHLFWQSDTVTSYKSDWGVLRLSGAVYNLPLSVTTTPTATPTLTLTPTATVTLTPTATATRTPSPTATDAFGAIRGTVWSDLNGDGLRQGGEPGLLGVMVNLFTQGVQIGATATAGDGSYSFGSLAPGNYEVRETNPAWLPRSSTLDIVNVTLAAGQTLTVDFGDWAGLTPTPTPTATRTATATPTVTHTSTPTRTRTPRVGPAEVFLPLVLRQLPLTPAAPALDPITPPEANPSYRVRWAVAARVESYVLERATEPTFGDATQVYIGTATDYIAASAGIATYYYRVKAHNAWGDSGWSNVQAAEARWELEPNGEAVDATATGAMQSGATYYGVLTSAESPTAQGKRNDYFYLNLTVAGKVEFWLSNMATAQDLDLVLRDASLNMVKDGFSGNPGTVDEHIRSSSLPPGRYYVQVSWVTGGSARPYHLRGVWQDNKAMTLVKTQPRDPTAAQDNRMLSRGGFPERWTLTVV